MNRRGFLASILAAGIAPAIVKASSLMPVIQTFTQRDMAAEVARRASMSVLLNKATLQMFSGTPENPGTLLASLAMAGDAASFGTINLSGQAEVCAMGRAQLARLVHEDGRVLIDAKVGSDFRLANDYLMQGSTLSVPLLKLSLS